MNSKPINLNGYDTLYSESTDARGVHLLIAIPPHAEKNISNICGSFVDGRLIKQVDYITKDNTRFIKAYY